MISVITSKDNPKIKLAASLKSRSKRKETGLFLFEGRKLLLEAIDCGIAVESVFLDEEKKEHYDEMMESLAEQGLSVYLLPHSLFLKVSDSETPQGLVTVARFFEVRSAAQVTGGKFLALEHLSDPGNMGAVLRSAEAFSLDGVILTKNSADLFSPKTVRGSMGSVFRVPCYYSDNLPADISLLKEKGFFTCCADLKPDALSLKDVKFPHNTVTVIGNESSGISDEMKKVCQKAVYIPMKGKNESLNASVAAGIIAWEMTRGEN